MLVNKPKPKQDWESPFFFNLMGCCDNEDDCKHWITPTLCIGSGTSSYEPFQVVVNANYPPNKIGHGRLGRREEKMGYSKCTLYLVGLCDHDSENIENYLEYLITRLRAKYEANPATKFLFHCFAGKSRSVALALAFMVEVLKMTFDDALALIKEKRPMVEPRPSFIEALRKRYESKIDTREKEWIQ